MSTGMFTLTAADVEVEEEVELSPKERWNNSIRAIRKSGVAIKQNVRTCCRSCVEPAISLNVKDDDQPWAYTYGGQGMATKWENDYKMVPSSTSRFVRGTPVTEVYFNHDNGAAKVVAETFRANGFTVEWDGNDNKCVVVKVNN